MLVCVPLHLRFLPQLLHWPPPDRGSLEGGSSFLSVLNPRPLHMLGIELSLLNGFHDSRGITHIREIHGALKDRGLRGTRLRHFHGEWVESRLPSPMKATKLTAVGAGRVKVSGWWAAWPRMAWGSRLLQRCPRPTALVTFSWPSSASLAVWPCCRESMWIWSYLAAKCVPEREARAITRRHLWSAHSGPWSLRRQQGWAGKGVSSGMNHSGPALLTPIHAGQ